MAKNGALSIASSGILYGLVTVGGSLLSKKGFSVLDISFFFMFFSVLVLAPFVNKRGSNIFAKMRHSWKYLSIYALVNLFIMLAQFGSLSLGLAPPTVALLLYTQPVWTIIFGRFIFSERITVTRILIIVIALFGVFLVTNPLSLLSNIQTHSSIISGATPQRLFGEVLALAGGLFLSFWVILGKKGRMEELTEPVYLTFSVRAFSVIPIGIVSFVAYLAGTRLFLSSSNDFSFGLIYLLLFSVFAGALPDYLFYKGVERIQALQAGVILLLEPISAAVLSAVLKIAVLSWIQILGGALILFSNYLVVSESPQRSGQRKKSAGYD